jgi:hypoxanthine phosphoribosyltransferase
MTDSQIQVLYDADTIRHRVSELGERLQRDFSDADPILISIIGGSVVFLADLLRAIRMPIRYETVQVQYSGAGGAADVLDIHFPISVPVADQQLILLKDVMATGITESYLASQFLDLGASEVRIVALIDLPDERKLDVSADYSLFTPRQSGTFVGYGLKVEGRQGHLPYIGRVVDA